MSNDSEGAWWKTLGFGLFMIGISVFLYYFFTDMETNGGSRRIHWLVAVLYNIGGKWITCSVFGLIGVLLIGLGIKEFNDR